MAQRSRALTVIAVAGLIAVASAVHAQTPAADPFYGPPTPLPAGRPGDIIRSRSSVFTVDPVLRAPMAGVTSYQILYRSESATGQPIAISGTVLVPTTPWTDGLRPLISYAIGTKGMGDECAPSYAFTQGTDYEGTPIASLLDHGWAVVVTDMEGLGTPGIHTYDVGWSQGKAVLDAARAAQRLPGSGISASAPIGITGYSQGGNSSLWAAQLAPTYAPELDIKGVVGGGAAVNLIATANYLNRTAYFAPVLMAAAGYDAAYRELDLEAYLNDRGKTVHESFQNICLVSFDGIASALGVGLHDMNEFTSLNPLTTEPWQARLNANKLGALKPTAPVMLTHGFLDQINPYSTALALRRDWCNLGAAVSWKPYCVADHGVGAAATFADGVPFLADRFAGKPADGNCGDPSVEGACGAGILPPLPMVDAGFVDHDAGPGSSSEAATLFAGDAAVDAAGDALDALEAAVAPPGDALASRSPGAGRGGCACTIERRGTGSPGAAALLIVFGAVWVARRARARRSTAASGARTRLASHVGKV